MPSRPWVYSSMTGHTPLTALVSTRIYESSAIKEVPKTKPYLMYRFLTDTSELRGDDFALVKSQSFMVLVHDVPGDYKQIDSILVMLKTIFDRVSNAQYNVVRSIWVDDSEDLRDDVMGTILRYGRYRFYYT